MNYDNAFLIDKFQFDFDRAEKNSKKQNKTKQN